jgi:hypothetical protein
VGEELRIVQHPDGYYWRSGTHEVGPYASVDDARADMQAAEAAEGGEGSMEPGETLQQAEDDIGVESWIDPETGALAEEQRPRIEDH